MKERATILLLPGNMCDERMWSGIVPELQEWRVVTPVPTQDNIAGMAQACLDAHPGRLIPIGFSMGGIVALALAKAAPERVAAIGLIDTNAGADLPERAAMRPRQQRDVQAGGLQRIVVEELQPKYFAAENRSDERLLALVLDMALALGPEVFVRQSEALRTRPDQQDVLPLLEVPSFLACGVEDQLCPPQLHQELAEGARAGELHIVPGAGHMLPLERPEELARLLKRWLTEVEKEQAA